MPVLPTDYSENTLVEQPAIALFASLEYQTANCFNEQVGGSATTLGRETTADVILMPRLRAALQKLNPGMGRTVIDGAIEELTRDRGAMSPAQANRDVYRLLKDGVKVTYQDDDGGESVETVRVIDWDYPENNDWFLASQFWVSGDLYRRRCDLVGFVNGLPLLFVELKKKHAPPEKVVQVVPKYLANGGEDTIPAIQLVKRGRLEKIFVETSKTKDKK